jgi:hypothetical protein
MSTLVALSQDSRLQSPETDAGALLYETGLLMKYGRAMSFMSL